MKIECPQCGFSRDVNPDRFPAQSVVATCPKCGRKFRISLAGEQAPNDPAMGSQNAEEEDIRSIANNAYRREYNKFPHAEDNKQSGAINPWQEAPGAIGWIASFYKTIVNVMFSAPAFFRSLPAQIPQTRPLAFYLILASLQTVVERFWSHMAISMLTSSPIADPQMQKLLDMAMSANNLAITLLLRCGMLVFQIYLFTALLYLAYRLMAPQKATFPLVFQIMAYSSAPSALCVVPILGSIAGALWGIGCMAVGFKAALNLSWGRVIIGFIPLLLFYIPFIYQLMGGGLNI